MPVLVRLQLASVMLGNLATEGHRSLVRLSDGSIGVGETLGELVQGRAAAEDEVVTELEAARRTAGVSRYLFACEALSTTKEACDSGLGRTSIIHLRKESNRSL